MKLEISKEWITEMAKREEGHEVGAGFETCPAPYRFFYRNHRGEEGMRSVIPVAVRFGATEWHPKDQWLLRAFDLEKRAEREFAMADILRVEGNSALVLASAPLLAKDAT